MNNWIDFNKEKPELNRCIWITFLDGNKNFIRPYSLYTPEKQEDLNTWDDTRSIKWMYVCSTNPPENN